MKNTSCTALMQFHIKLNYPLNYSLGHLWFNETINIQNSALNLLACSTKFHLTFEHLILFVKSTNSLWLSNPGLCTVWNGQYMCIVSFFCLKFYRLRWDHCFLFSSLWHNRCHFILNMSRNPINQYKWYITSMTKIVVMICLVEHSRKDRALTWCRRHNWDEKDKRVRKQWKQQICEAVFYCDMSWVLYTRNHTFMISWHHHKIISIIFCVYLGWGNLKPVFQPHYAREISAFTVQAFCWGELSNLKTSPSTETQGWLVGAGGNKSRKKI